MLFADTAALRFFAAIAAAALFRHCFSYAITIALRCRCFILSGYGYAIVLALFAATPAFTLFRCYAIDMASPFSLIVAAYDTLFSPCRFFAYSAYDYFIDAATPLRCRHSLIICCRHTYYAYYFAILR